MSDTPGILRDFSNRIYQFNVQFKGIDDWNRPVFKVIDEPIYFGSVNTLFNWETPKDEVVNHFKNSGEQLEYFGTKFGCEPQGGTPKTIKIVIHV